MITGAGISGIGMACGLMMQGGGRVELWSWAARHFRELLSRPSDGDFDIHVPSGSGGGLQ